MQKQELKQYLYQILDHYKVKTKYSVVTNTKVKTINKHNHSNVKLSNNNKTVNELFYSLAIKNNSTKETLIAFELYDDKLFYADLSLKNLTNFLAETLKELTKEKVAYRHNMSLIRINSHSKRDNDTFINLLAKHIKNALDGKTGHVEHMMNLAPRNSTINLLESELSRIDYDLLIESKHDRLDVLSSTLNDASFNKHEDKYYNSLVYLTREMLNDCGNEYIQSAIDSRKGILASKYTLSLVLSYAECLIRSGDEFESDTSFLVSSMSRVDGTLKAEDIVTGILKEKLDDEGYEYEEGYFFNGGASYVEGIKVKQLK